MSKWFDSAFDDFLAEHDAQDAAKAAIADMRTAFLAGAHAGIEFAKVCVDQELVDEDV